MTRGKLYIAIVFLVLSLAAGVRLWHLSRPDLNLDELHYATEAYNWLRGDSSISFRRHPFQHPEPNMGHPFAPLSLTAFAFQIAGPSVYTARIVSAMCGILMILLILLFNGELQFTALATGLLYAILPLAVRYNRAAYLDSIFAVCITLSVLSIWRYHRRMSGLIWLVLAGVASGLAISTKLNGLLVIVLDIGLIVVSRRKSSEHVTHIKQTVVTLGIVLAVVLVTVVLFNDIPSYIDGIMHPSDPIVYLLSVGALQTPLRFPIEIFPVVWMLLSPGIAIAGVMSILFSFRRKSHTNTFLLLWFFGTLLIALVQGIGGSGEWGWLPMIPPFLFITVRTILLCNPRYFRICIIALAVIALPYTYMYGLYIKPLPFRKSILFNRTQKDVFYQNIILMINCLTPMGGKIYIESYSEIPIFMLRRDIQITNDKSVSDVAVVDGIEADVSDTHILYKTASAIQNGVVVMRYIYKKR